MRSRYNHSRQRVLPVKAINYKKVKNVNRKVFNTNSYTVGHRYNSWHCFMDTLAICAVWIFKVVIVVAILLGATIMIWA